MSILLRQNNKRPDRLYVCMPFLQEGDWKHLTVFLDQNRLHVLRALSCFIKLSDIT